jgi:hypothetical protein
MENPMKRTDLDLTGLSPRNAALAARIMARGGIRGGDGSGELTDLLAAVADPESLTDEAVTETLTGLRAAAAALAEDVTDEALAQLGQIADAIEALNAVVEARGAADAERAAAAEALLTRINGEAEAGDEGEGGEADDAAAGETDDDAGEAEAEEEPVAIAAAATPAAPVVARVSARRPAAVAPRTPAAPSGELVLTASANLPGITAGAKITGPDNIARAFSSVLASAKGYQGPRVNMPIASLGFRDPREMYGDERTLDDNTASNRRKLDAIVNPTALIASGGICAPAPIMYDQSVIGETARPFRDQFLTRFGADRGGVRTLVQPLITDVTGAIATWTEANDTTPSSPTTKPCLTMTCPDDVETLVDAITRCVEVGNFRAKYFSEQVEAILAATAIAHARHAEVKLMNDFTANATATTSSELLGATRDVLAVLDRTAATWRYRYRLAPNFPFDWAAPAWLLPMLRTDLAREMPGSADERLAVADSKIESFFAARNIRPVWLLDGETGQTYGTQADGPVTAWKSTVVTYFGEAGTSLFLDGGSLDFGLVRDSTLNGTNDAQFFSETFEAFHPHGREWHTLTMNICPSGAAAALEDTSLLCTSGS